MESAMIGENIDGFISCIGNGVRGVSVPPEIMVDVTWCQINGVN